MVPSCEILRTTAPSAWTADILIEMSTSAFSNCLELMGHDPYFESYQHAKLFNKVKEIYGPVSSLSQFVISQLGGLAVLLTAEELSRLQLYQLSSIAALGSISTWNNSQLAALFGATLRSIAWSESQLESSTLVAMGHIVCGATPAQMKRFNPVEFSKAVLWLGKLNLSCSEEQLLTLLNLLTYSLAFGSMDTWGSDVFIEIGALAAGLPDLAMSALVKEQIEGLTPLAISLVPPSKLAAAFMELQLSMFSYEQAAAVTKKQLSSLSPSQVTALDIVLTSSENRTINIRGRSLGPPLTHSPLCVTVGLLMLLIALHCPDLICPGT
ncbi:stereocilin-like [Thalassophryne amazonica]|uniref:stereocilin-like n=1 Tax=Thalassophryne amazonica TaxID=390379 RepID=UPI0014719B87|nr:stereocilin-like [Thalassophryne amazonica]